MDLELDVPSLLVDGRVASTERSRFGTWNVVGVMSHGAFGGFYGEVPIRDLEPHRTCHGPAHRTCFYGEVPIRDLEHRAARRSRDVSICASTERSRLGTWNQGTATSGSGISMLLRRGPD